MSKIIFFFIISLARCGLPGLLPVHGDDGSGEDLGAVDEKL